MFSKFTAGITSKRGKFRLRQGKRGNKQMRNATELSKRVVPSPPTLSSPSYFPLMTHDLWPPLIVSAMSHSKKTFERAAHKLLMHDLFICRALFKGTLVLPCPIRLNFTTYILPFLEKIPIRDESPWTVGDSSGRMSRSTTELPQVQSIREVVLRGIKRRK